MKEMIMIRVVIKTPLPMIEVFTLGRKAKDLRSMVCSFSNQYFFFAPLFLTDLLC
jgi:hypothetical protein